MIPTSFEYKRVQTVDEALSLLNEDTKILAGGHSLIPAMKLRLNQPETLIDITRIPGLRDIRDGGDHLVIGANATHHDIVKSELVRSAAPIMSQGAELIGDLSVRNRGTIGGSIAHADPAADWPAILIACNATVRIRGKNGQRDLPADQFFTGFFETALEENELITEIHVPKQGNGTRGYYAKFPQPASRFAIVGCAVVLTNDNGSCRKVNIAFNGVSDFAFRDEAAQAALEGKEPTTANIAAAAAAAAEGVPISSDPFASEAYRKHLAKVYTKRALTAVV